MSVYACVHACVCFTCTYVCLWHTCLMPVEDKDIIGSSGAGVTEDYGLGSKPGQLQEQNLLLTPRLSFPALPLFALFCSGWVIWKTQSSNGRWDETGRLHGAQSAVAVENGFDTL